MSVLQHSIGFTCSSTRGYTQRLKTCRRMNGKLLSRGRFGLLKRHRDLMFRDNPEFGPISMIITNFAAHAYRGEADI